MKQVFVASDGTQFDGEEDAMKHENVMGKKGAILKWAEEHYKNKRLTNKQANVVLAWEANRDDALRVI